MKKQFVLVGIVVTALALLFSGCAKGAEKTINLGFIGPLTGDAANYGKLMTQAIKIAVEERNAKNGIGGMKVNFIAEDSEGKVDKANAGMEKLASVDHVWGLVGAVFSSSSLAIAPKAQAEKIVMISPSSTHKDLISKGDYIFRDVASDALQAQVFGRYVAQVMKIKTVATLYTKNDYSQGLAEGFKQAFEASGGKIVDEETSLQGDKDFKTQLTKIKAANPEAIYLPNYVAEIEQCLDQVKQLGIKAKILSSDGFSNPEVLSVSGANANGVVFSGPEQSAKSAKTAAFEQTYKTKWNEAPDAFSLNSYDAANIIMDAIQTAYDNASPSDQKALKLDRGVIRSAVAKTANYDGVSGTITFDKQTRDVVKNIGISTVENQQFKQLEVYTVQEGNLVKVR
ncbi:MAG TPA: ABC transporter substrate-binding protein [Spirochaetia bacterium]|nr:ABC transporter substrate-binding protein [Spirochaetia bacterium]